MKFFSLLTRPYSTAIKSVASSGMRIKNSIEDVSETIENRKNKNHIRYVDADNSTEAFELLFIENEWTEEELIEKSSILRKSRFIMMGFSWASAMTALFFITHYIGVSWFLAMIFPMFFLSVAMLCGLNALRYSLYFEQIHKRDLITLKQFMKEGEFIRKFFG